MINTFDEISHMYVYIITCNVYHCPFHYIHYIKNISLRYLHHTTLRLMHHVIFLLLVYLSTRISLICLAYSVDDGIQFWVHLLGGRQCDLFPLCFCTNFCKPFFSHFIMFETFPFQCFRRTMVLYIFARTIIYFFLQIESLVMPCLLPNDS